MTQPAATKIDKQTEARAKRACKKTKLRIADLLRIGLDRVLYEIETTGSLKIQGGEVK